MRKAPSVRRRWLRRIRKVRYLNSIIIRMFMEVGGPHHVPHFHAYYQEDVGIFSIDPIELIAGSLPKRQRRLVEAWAELRQAELAADWEQLQQGKTPKPIEPLQ
jgi:Domain of unknown function (DUF4160)